MLRLICSYLLFSFLALAIQAQGMVYFPLLSSTPAADGVINVSEWAEGDTIRFESRPGDSIRVITLRSDTSLFFQFAGKLESANIRFPEITFDPENNRTPTWEVTDSWFHVSATDCESFGAPQNYDSCQTIRPNWTAAPNFSPGGVKTDTVEIEIPLSTIGLVPGITDTFGISFNVTNTSTAFEYWPVGANQNNPSTWGTGILLDGPLASMDPLLRLKPLEVYPNPAGDVIHILGPGEIRSNRMLEIFSLSGKVIRRIEMNGSGIDLDISSMSPGVYFIRSANEGNVLPQKLVVR